MRRNVFKLLVFLILFACLMFNVSPVFAFTPDNFSDVPTSHWAYQSIINISRLGVIAGYPDGTFKPEQFVSREEFAKILCGATSIPIANPQANTFEDVTKDDWAFRYVETVKDYLTGYPSSGGGKPLFKGKMDATREDVAVALVKIKGFDKTVIPDPTILEHMYKDTDSISSKVKNLVAIAVQKKIIQGYPDQSFRGNQTLTRAEAAAIIDRANTIAGDIKDIISNTGENNNSTHEVDLIYLSIDCPKAFGKVGEKLQALANGVLSNGQTRDITEKVTWNSSNNSILTIDDKGSIYLVKEGTAQIFAALNGIIDKQEITVLPKSPSKPSENKIKQIKVSPEISEIKTGKSVDLKAESIDEGGRVSDVTNEAIWASNNNDTAIVSSQGKVFGLKEGITLIKATYKGQTGYSAVSVTESVYSPPSDTQTIVLNTISISNRLKRLEVGEKHNVKAVGTYSNSEKTDITNKVVWSTSNENVATVNAKGEITAVHDGMAIITAKLDGKSSTMFVLVKGD